jgi:hypothetical protein
MMNIDAGAIADTEAMNRIVLNVNIMDRAGSENTFQFNEVVGSVKQSVTESSTSRADVLRHTAITSKPIPPCLTIAI